MIKFFQKNLFSLMLAITCLLPVLTVGQLAYADNLINGADNAACSGATLGGSGCPNETTNDSTIDNVIKAVVDILTIIVGLAAVIVIIVQGLRFILSGGDSNTTANARNAILYAIAGLIIVTMAQILVHYVIGKATNIP